MKKSSHDHRDSHLAVTLHRQGERKRCRPACSRLAASLSFSLSSSCRRRWICAVSISILAPSNACRYILVFDLEPGTRPRRGLLSEPVAFTDQQLCGWSTCARIHMDNSGCLPRSCGKQLGAGEDLVQCSCMAAASSRRHPRTVSIVSNKSASQKYSCE